MITIFQLKIDFATVTSANPVALHGQHIFRPALKIVTFGKQFISVCGYTEKPLIQFFLLNGMPATPAATIFNLFVGEHGLTIVTPVHL